MFVQELLDRAATAGIRLTVTRDFHRLRIDFARRPEEDLLRLLEQHEIEIVAALLARNPLGPGRSMPFGVSGKTEKEVQP